LWPSGHRTVWLNHLSASGPGGRERHLRLPAHTPGNGTGVIMRDATLNPVELEIARNRLESISEEVGTALIQTSYSPNIKDRRDCSASIYGPDGMLISQSEHIPLHLGLMPTLSKNALACYGTEHFVDGDVLLTNTPYLGGSRPLDM